MLTKLKQNSVRLISIIALAIALILLLLFHAKISSFFGQQQLQHQNITVQPVTAAPIAPQPTLVTVKTTPKAPTKNNETNLLQLQGYTIQLLGVSDFNNLNKFIAQNNLGNKAHIFHTTNNERDWYTLIYGNYPTKEKAENASKQLPPALQKLKPWIRSMDSVHSAMLQSKL